MKIKRFEFNMFPVNCYVLWDETKEAVVIDPGCFYEEEKQVLKKFILSNELNVKHLLNTHLHLDHIFGNPFIALKTWTYRAVWFPFILYIVIDILLAPSHLFEHIYMESILEYDALNVISLNWAVLLGIIVGAGFTFFTFSRRKWRYKTMTVIAFSSITGYLMYFYFGIDYALPKETLFVPLFLRSFGYVIIAICFLTVLSRVPFQHFFQAVSVQSFVSAGFGGALGTAILGHALNGAMKKNSMLLGSVVDHVNPFISRIPVGEVYGAVQQQALMVSMKELYGWLTLMALFCLLAFLVYESDIRPYKVLHPTYRSIRRFVKHELRIDKKLEATA